MEQVRMRVKGQQLVVRGGAVPTLPPKANYQVYMKFPGGQGGQGLMGSSKHKGEGTVATLSCKESVSG